MTILAIDVGSSSVRAVLFEQRSEGVRLIPDAIIQKPYQFDTDNTGKATINPLYLRELVESCIDDILQHKDAQTITAVGMDSFVGNIIALDKKENPLSDVDTYADTRSAPFIDSLEQSMDTEAYHQRTGALINTAYYLPKLQFYAQELAHISTFTDFATYCYRQWFGKTIPMSYSVASWSGVLNRETLLWDEPSLSHSVYSQDNFPDLADYQQFQQGLIDIYAQRWRALAETPFYLAVGDGAAAQVGSGAIADNTATLTIGTTAAIRKISREKLPSVPQGCWSYRIDADHHLIGGALSEGGNVFAWAKNTLQLDGLDIETELKKIKPAQHGLTILPLLNGERSPGWRGDATATIHGLRMNTKPIEILYALLESVALRLAIIAEQLQLGQAVKLMASGGALHHSPVWAQILADALGRPLYVLDEAQVTALGVAQLVYCAKQKQALSGASPKIFKVYQPNSDYTKQYKDLIERQNTLYKLTENLS